MLGLHAIREVACFIDVDPAVQGDHQTCNLGIATLRILPLSHADAPMSNFGAVLLVGTPVRLQVHRCPAPVSTGRGHASLNKKCDFPCWLLKEMITTGMFVFFQGT